MSDERRTVPAKRARGRSGEVVALLVALCVAVLGPAAGVLWIWHGWVWGVLLGAAVLGPLVWLAAPRMGMDRKVVAVLLTLGGGVIGSSGAAAWSDLTMERRGDRVDAVVAEDRKVDSKNTEHYYTLRHVGTAREVKGGELNPDTEALEVGERVAVLEDPQGALAPTLPEDLHATRWTACWGVAAPLLWGLLVWNAASASRPSGFGSGAGGTGKGAAGVRRRSAEET